MGKPTGFMEYERRAMPARDPSVRLSDWYEIYTRADDHTLREQGARCMDCGVPFCQSDTGCPIDNLIPEWNDLVYHDQWHDAYLRLARTNNFPEFTGRICPAPCEHACVLGITDPPVTIKSIECAIIDRAFEEGWVQPNPPETRTGKRVAVVGSGPAGLAAADQLNQAGHHVTVFERDDRVGGLLMYGVPNMKLDKRLVDRRVDVLRRSGIEFKTGANVGVDIDPDDLRRHFDAVILACGALQGRELDIPGRDLDGVHLAMEYLHSTTKALLDSGFNNGVPITAKGKDVVVIGGGDTGADCIGTALRQGCNSVFNITRREREPDDRDADHAWPGDPGTYYLDYSHAEGVARFGRDPREYGCLPLEFLGNDDGRVTHVRVERLDWSRDDAGKLVSTRTGKTDDLPADLVFFAIGFTGHDTPALVEKFGVETTKWGTVTADYGQYATNVEGVYVAGDMRRGASLIVWAIAEGRGAAHHVDAYLMGESTLPAPDVDAGLVSSAG
ncbi:MAG: glutamate synthase subunit beta [Planctomycetota bacterium]